MNGWLHLQHHCCCCQKPKFNLGCNTQEVHIHVHIHVHVHNRRHKTQVHVGSPCSLTSADLFADSTLRVRDVIKDFHPGGRLAQHSFGEVSHWKNICLPLFYKIIPFDWCWTVYKSHSQYVIIWYYLVLFICFSLPVKPFGSKYDANTRLVPVFCPQCMDAVGFCLFLKTYLEVDDFPADFCQRLFRYFQHAEQDANTKTPMPKGGWWQCSSDWKHPRASLKNISCCITGMQHCRLMHLFQEESSDKTPLNFHSDSFRTRAVMW